MKPSSWPLLTSVRSLARSSSLVSLITSTEYFVPKRVPSRELRSHRLRDLRIVTDHGNMLHTGGLHHRQLTRQKDHAEHEQRQQNGADEERLGSNAFEIFAAENQSDITHCDYPPRR